MVSYGVILVWYYMVLYGILWFDMSLYGIIWFDMVYILYECMYYMDCVVYIYIYNIVFKCPGSIRFGQYLHRPGK